MSIKKKIIISALILGIGAFLSFVLYKVYFLLNNTHPSKEAPSTSLSSHSQKDRFVFVDMIRIREESEPFKILDAFFENRHSESQQQIFNFENELRQEDKELRDKEKMSEAPNEELALKRQAFDKKVADLAQITLEKKNALNTQFNDMRLRIEAKLSAVIEGIAKEKHASFVFNKSLGHDAPLILYGHSDLDITDKVIEKLNASQDELNLDVG